MKHYSLSRQEIIKNKRVFEQLFSNGKTVASVSRMIRARYLIIKQPNDIPVKIAIGVSKRVGNAVWRNRLKRLLRESYRLHKHFLISACEKKQVSLCVVFSPISLNQKKHNRISVHTVMPEIKDIIEKITEAIHQENF